MKRRTILILFVLFLLLIPTGAALAQSSDTTVLSGDTVNDDIVLLEGDLTIEEGATVNGDVTILDGDATIAGRVNGNVVLFDGQLNGEETAVINGDCLVLSGEIDDVSEQGLECTNVSSFAPQLSGLLDSIPAVPAIPAIPAAPAAPVIPVEPAAPIRPSFEDVDSSGGGHFWGSLAGAIFRTIALGLVAFAVASIFPQQAQEVERTMRGKPMVSGIVGFLTMLAAPMVIAVLLLVCGLGIVVAVALAAAWTLGWFAAGNIVGKRLAEWFHLQNRSLPVTMALGTAVLTFVLGLMGAIPFFIGEGLLGFVIAWIGLGAVALTKFGTRPYPLQEPEIRILNDEKVTAVLNTLPEDDIRFK